MVKDNDQGLSIGCQYFFTCSVAKLYTFYCSSFPICKNSYHCYIAIIGWVVSIPTMRAES